MSAPDPQHAEAHRLRAEHGWGARRIAEALEITRYAASVLLARPLPQPVAEEIDEVAEAGEPVADEVAEDDQLPADVVAGVAEPVAGAGTRGPLPRRIPDDEIVIDLRRWPALRRDLAALAQTGRTPSELINQAVVVLGFGYRKALDEHRVEPGQPIVVRDLYVTRYTAALTERPAPPPPGD
ncbi:hypothetical protein [Streptomyces sp. V2]|uniref:hypothetical protein n=1 Tax=Streptomyces sp. V2 TaxID=1424099 RepID=UPI0014032B62|nr:hypothetical protein [Streptomyces sp. V2]